MGRWTWPATSDQTTSPAVASQILFFLVVTTLPYWLGFGASHEDMIVPSTGMSTRNSGAALAPLVAAAGKDQEAINIVVPGFPIMVLFAWLATKWFGERQKT